MIQDLAPPLLLFPEVTVTSKVTVTCAALNPGRIQANRPICLFDFRIYVGYAMVQRLELTCQQFPGGTHDAALEVAVCRKRTHRSIALARAEVLIGAAASTRHTGCPGGVFCCERRD